MSNFSFKTYKPLSLRLWHWTNALVILALLATVLIRKTLLSWRTNSALIQEKMNAINSPITADYAKEIAVAIRDPLWEWHNYLGITLGVLFVSRILIAFFIEKKCFGIKTLMSALCLKKIPAPEKSKALHFASVRILYATFYIVTLLMVSTGFLLYFKSTLALSKPFATEIKEIHELMMWFFVFFTGIHILGVIIAENRNDRGLVSEMIHGGEHTKQ